MLTPDEILLFIFPLGKRITASDFIKLSWGMAVLGHGPLGEKEFT